MADPAPRIVILGGGGHACVVAEALIESGTPAAGHIAPEPGDSELLGSYLGTDERIPDLISEGARFALGIGFVDAEGQSRRERLLHRLRGADVMRVVHPKAIVSEAADIGVGAFVAAGAIICVGVTIGAYAIVNTGAIVDHHSWIGQGTHVATGASIAGKVTVGTSCLIGLRSALRQGVTLGDGVIIGAGAVVVSNIGDGTTAFGVPARVRSERL